MAPPFIIIPFRVINYGAVATSHGSQTQTGESKLIRDHSLDTQGNFNCEILA